MQESNALNLIAEFASSSVGGSHAASQAIRDAIWPEGMPGTFSQKYATALTAFSSEDQAFFEVAIWPMADAIWMLPTGEAPVEPRDERRRGFDNFVANQDDRSVRKPHMRAVQRANDVLGESYAAWWAALSAITVPAITAELFDGVAVVIPYPRHFHEWIRWATFFELPIHRRFWEAFFAWKVDRWSSGKQMAWLCALKDDTWQPLPSAPVPSETTWRIPIGLEHPLIEHFAAPVRFVNNWQLPAREVLAVIEGTVPPHLARKDGIRGRLKKGKRIRMVGSPLLERIGAAVAALAQAYDLSPERDGRYHFGFEQALLMMMLVVVDETLAKCAPRTISNALPAFVRGEPSRGRPRRT